jgi:pimeloyl-ACP methyl ester carboxylesterase
VLRSDPEPMERTIGGERTFIHTGGIEADWTRPVVVLIHGAGQDHSHFRFHTRALAHSGVTALAIDLPGHGRSEGAVLASVEEMARWVIAMLDDLEIERAILVGHSMGSLISMEAAASFPDRIGGLVLTGTGSSMPVHPALQDAANRADHLAVELIAGWIHTGDDRLGGHPQPGSWTRGITERLAEQELGRSLGPDLEACTAFDPAARAAELRIPVTVVIGAADSMTNARAGRELVSVIAGARVVEIAGTGHNMVMDHPREIRIAILDMVRIVFGS